MECCLVEKSGRRSSYHKILVFHCWCLYQCEAETPDIQFALQSIDEYILKIYPIQFLVLVALLYTSTIFFGSENKGVTVSLEFSTCSKYCNNFGKVYCSSIQSFYVYCVGLILQRGIRHTHY